MLFRGKYDFLSNMYSAKVTMHGNTYPSVENAFQAMKTTNPDIRKQFISMNPVQAKKAGRLLTLREDWQDIKLEVMYYAVKRKFEQNPSLKQQLILLDDSEIVEDNLWGDHYWGRCNGIGLNNLGQILMKVRSGLRDPVVM